MKRYLAILFLVAFVFSAAFGQTPLEPRPAFVKPTTTVVDASRHEMERIYVKFRDDLPVRLREGKLVAVGANANALNAVRGLLNRLDKAGAKWDRQHSVPEERLNELREKAQRNTGKVIPDLNTAFNLRLPKGLKAEKVINELNALEPVEIAEPIPIAAPDPVAGNYQSQQGYLNPAPGGIDAQYAWTQLAGAGGNVWIADIESNWNFSHADLNNPTLLGAASTLTAQANIDHGTAVLGILSSRNDGVGTTGIAYNSTIFVAARTTAAGYNPAAAITLATAALRTGDIIILEMQTDGPAAGSADLVPIEWESASYNAIVTAVGTGIIVVEAAGNGNQNLDDPIFNTGHSPFLPAHDSGAIIVGAGAVPGGSDTDRSRLGFSCYGSTVDLQGWGENVISTGYGDLYSASGMNSYYTNSFNGTSSATPTVTGACACLQAHHKVTTVGAVLTPLEMREILRATGSPQTAGTNPVSQNIGPRPNLALALPLVSGPTTWVQFGYSGTELGTFPQPFNTLAEGRDAAAVGGTLIFKGGTNAFTGTITKQLTLKTYGSPVTLGQ